MRRLLLLLLSLIVVAAACSDEAAPTTTTTSSTTSTSTTTTSTTTTSTTTTTTTTTTLPPTTTTTLPPDPQFALSFDGFEHFGVLGDPAEDVITAFTEAFGDPTADSDWREEHGCTIEGRVRTITWIDPGVRLTFADGVTEFGEGEHLVTFTTLLPVESSWRLFGVHRGMTVTQIESLFPDAVVIEGDGLDSLQFDPEIPSYALIDSGGEIRDFWGGVDYCDPA